MKGKLPALLLACLLLTGCDGSIANGEGNPDIAENENVSQSACSLEEIRAAAEYMRLKYGMSSENVVPKVILDCDMTYLGDDAMCMSILARADTLGLIDLLGITVTGGNSFVAYGANAALNQLELIGRADIPVCLGTDIPLAGFRDMEEQEKIVGQISHWGALFNTDNYMEPEMYHDLGPLFERKWGYSRTDPLEQSSTDFLLEQTAQYPGEVILVSVGPATNIALACKADDSFAQNTAGIIYMAGVFTGQGSFTPYADFNCFYDPEAYKICFESAFPSQIIVPHETAEAAMLDKSVFDLMDTKNETPAARLWLENCYGLYKRTPSRRDSCADAIAAVVLLCPELVTERGSFSVTVSTDLEAPEYGQTTVLPAGEGAAGNTCADFILDLETERYWEFVTDLLCGETEE